MKCSTRATAAVAVFGVAVVFSSCGGVGREPSAESLSDDTTTTVVSEQSLNTTTTLAVEVGETSDDVDEASDRVGNPVSVVTTTTIPVLSEVAASDDALVLSRYGVGDHRFGDDANEVITSLAELFGLPSSDVTRRYREGESGEFVDRNSDFVFVDLFGRETCFDSGFVWKVRVRSTTRWSSVDGHSVRQPARSSQTGVSVLVVAGRRSLR